MASPDKYNKKLDKNVFQPPGLKSHYNIDTADGETSYQFEQKPNTAIGMYNKKVPNMKQVNSKGISFPMVDPNKNSILNPIAAQEGSQSNRAGGAPDRNVLKSNPNTGQPMDKFPASRFKSEQFNSNMASSQGQPFENNPATNTPQEMNFPQDQQAFAAYGDPKRVKNTEAEEVAKGGDEVKKEMEKKGAEMDAESAESKQKLIRAGKAVATGGMSEITGGMTEVPNIDPSASQSLGASGGSDMESFFNKGGGSGMYAMKPMQALKSMSHSRGKNKSMASAMFEGPSKALQGNQDQLPDHLQKAIQNSSGMYGVDTKITKGNVSSAKRDDKAHIDYLKRDIKYDNSHGGSNKSMTNDEKHISKLAGDIKYDTYKKKKYDNV